MIRTRGIMSKIFSTDGAVSKTSDKLVGILFTGLLWIVCSLPLITIGASTTAAYYTMVKTVRKSTGYTSREFFRAFRLNFKDATVISLIYILVAAVLFIDITAFSPNTDEFSNILILVLYMVAFLAAGSFLFIFPFLSRFKFNKKELFRFSMLAMFRHLPTAIANLIMLFVTIIGIYLMPWGIFCFPGFFMFALTFLMERVMKFYMPKPVEGTEEAEKWYYK